jgi:hypothetical protein
VFFNTALPKSLSILSLSFSHAKERPDFLLSINFSIACKIQFPLHLKSENSCLNLESREIGRRFADIFCASREMEGEDSVTNLAGLFSQMTHEKREKSFKSSGTPLLSQSKRREERLKAQRKSRYNCQKLIRATLGATQDILSEGQEEGGRRKEGEENREHVEVEVEEGARGKKRKAREISHVTRKDRAFQRSEAEYRDALMTPEPFEELPEDLEESWICVPLPPGRRVLVVAHQSITCVRLRTGALVTSFKSGLPGGGKKSAPAKVCCILDCIMHDPSFTLYVGGGKRKGRERRRGMKQGGRRRGRRGGRGGERKKEERKLTGQSGTFSTSWSGRETPTTTATRSSEIFGRSTSSSRKTYPPTSPTPSPPSLVSPATHRVSMSWMGPSLALVGPRGIFCTTRRLIIGQSRVR